MMILIQYHSKNNYIIDFIFMGGAKVWCVVIFLQIFIENTGKTLGKRLNVHNFEVYLWKKISIRVYNKYFLMIDVH